MKKKSVLFVGSARKDISSFPDEVKLSMGHGIYLAQIGEKHPDAKPLKGFGGAGILEIVDDHDGDTYRAVYTVRYDAFVYVLHAFQTKSKRGVATSRADTELIKARLRAAEEDYRSHWKGESG